MTTTGLTYIGETDREAQRVWDAWVAAGRPKQLALDLLSDGCPACAGFGYLNLNDDDDDDRTACNHCR